MKIKAENIFAWSFMVQLKLIRSVLKIHNKRITALNLFLIYIIIYCNLYFLFSLSWLTLWVPCYLQ